jgi:hypothetical protein
VTPAATGALEGLGRRSFHPERSEVQLRNIARSVKALRDWLDAHSAEVESGSIPIAEAYPLIEAFQAERAGLPDALESSVADLAISVGTLTTLASIKPATQAELAQFMAETLPQAH